jgi:hypothetical protein
MHAPVNGQRIVDRHADLSNVVADCGAVCFEHVALENGASALEQRDQVIVHGLPLLLTVARKDTTNGLGGLPYLVADCPRALLQVAGYPTHIVYLSIGYVLDCGPAIPRSQIGSNGLPDAGRRA